MTKVGVPYRSPARYVGPGVSQVPVIRVSREPTASDDKFPLSQFWLIGESPTTGSEGDLWYLERIDGPNEAVWSQFCTGGVSATFWEYTADASKQAEQNRGYVCDNASGVEVTLPTSAEFGSLLSLTAESGTWKLAQGAGQSVVLGDHQTTVGAAGYLESTSVGDSLALVCIDENTTWQAVDGDIGNISIDGTTFNNALNQYSHQFEVGADAKGVSGSTTPLAVQVNTNSPTGIAVKNDTDDTDSAAVTNYQIDSGSVQGNVGTYSPSYTTNANLAARTVVTSSGVSANGIAFRCDTGQNLLMLKEDAIALEMSDEGAIINPLQPSCCAFLSASQSNVTGNGTQYIVPFDSEVWDVGSNFNTTTYTFTAPETGKYHVSSIVGVSDANLGTRGFLTYFVTSNRVWITETIDASKIYDTSNQFRLNASGLVDLDEGDTLTIDVKGVGSGSDDLGILGAANVNTSVTIYLAH